MPNKVAKTAAAALAAASLLDISMTPKGGPAPVPTSPTAITAPATPSAAKQSVSKTTSSGTAKASAEDPSFPSSVIADRSSCDDAGTCVYYAPFWVVNGTDETVDVTLVSQLSDTQGEPVDVDLNPAKFSIPPQSGKVQPLAIEAKANQAAKRDCLAVLNWKSDPLRPAPNTCLPAEGHLLANFSLTPMPNTKKSRDKAEADAKAKKGKQPPEPPGVKQQLLSFSIPVIEPSGWAGELIRYTFVVPLVASLVAIVLVRKKFNYALASSDVDLDKSIAANITFAGGLMTAGLLAALPSATRLMTSRSYSVLTGFAALLVLVGPALFKVTQGPVTLDGEERMAGRVWASILAGGILLWGALVQIATFWLQLVEMAEAHTLGLDILTFFSYLLLLMAVALSLYVPIFTVKAAEKSIPRYPENLSADEKKNSRKFLGMLSAIPAKPTADPGAWKLP